MLHDCLRDRSQDGGCDIKYGKLDSYDFTALHHAAYQGKTEALGVILMLGGDVHAVNRSVCFMPLILYSRERTVALSLLSSLLSFPTHSPHCGSPPNACSLQEGTVPVASDQPQIVTGGAHVQCDPPASGELL